MNNNINLKIKATMGDLVNKLRNADSGFSKLTGSVKKGTSGFNKFQQSNRKVNNSLSNLNKDANRARGSLNSLSNGMGVLQKAIIGINAYALGKGISHAINANIEMIETINLYNNAMGMFAESTDKAIQSLSDFTGLDKTNTQNKVGTYNLLARSMGITSENASILSENINRLSLDLSSLTNTSIQQVSEDLKSGLIGQSRTLYKYGIDATEAGIATEALAQGITKSVRNMTQGEKMVLRYSIIIRQAGLSHGDFARTIETPANQLKILSERFVTLSRAIGSVFIPMLQSVLPYINAVVIVLTRLFNSLAKFLGYVSGKKVENINNDNFLGIPDGTDKAEKGIGKTGKAVKKLKGQLMGFDEINLWKEPEDPSSGGKGKKDDGGGSSPFDMELPTLENAFKNMTNRAEELADKLEGPFKTILKLVEIIGVSMLAWKIANTVAGLPLAMGETLRMVKRIGLMPTLSLFTDATKFLKAGVIAILILRFIDLIKHSEMFRKGLSTIWNTAKNVFKWMIDLVKSLIAWFGKLIMKVLDLFPESWKRNVVKVFNAISKVAKALNLDIGDITLTLLAMGAFATGHPVVGGILLAFEAITLAVRAVGYGASDSIDEFDRFANVGKATAKKLEPFMDTMTDLENQLKTLEWGNMVIDDKTIGEIGEKLSSVTEMIINELDSNKNEALSTLEPLKKALGKEAYNKLVLANEEYYEKMKVKVKKDESTILEIMKTHRDENGKLSKEGYKKINKIQAEMSDTGIRQLTESEVEYNAIMNNLKDNSERISLEQATSIIKNSKETKDKTINDAKLQYSKVELEAQRMLDVGAINEEQYEEIIASSEKTRDDTIENANKQYGEINKATEEGLGKTAKYFNTETGEIRSKWDVFLTGMLGGINTWMDDTSKAVNDNGDEWEKKMESFRKAVSKWWSELGGNLTKGFSETWDGIKQMGRDYANAAEKFCNKEAWIKRFKGMGKGLVTMFKNSINASVKLFNIFIDWLNDKMEFSWNDFKIAGQTIIKEGSFQLFTIPHIPQLADGGIVDAGQAFIAREAGPELVGSHNGKTGVMNNNQIVQAVSEGVYGAVTSAMKISQAGNSSGEKELIINLDGKEMGRVLLPKMNNESKRLGYQPILNYK